MKKQTEYLFLILTLLVIANVGCSPKTNLTDKDPNDYTLTSNSTKWETESYFCPVCLTTIDHSEFLSKVCNNCGTVSRYHLDFKSRSCRKIIKDSKWIWQYKYEDRTELSEKRLHD